jgi:predicted NBD/HSP70 family sugar kinase
MSARERMTVTLSYDAVDGRWSISGTPSGPAGFVDLWLSDDVEILVDVVEPERLVEITGTLPDPDLETALPPVTHRLVAALLGGEVAGRLDRLVKEGLPEVEIQCEPTAALNAVGRLALLERLRATSESPSSWWAAEAAILADEVDHPKFVAHAKEEARLAAPMLAAVATVPDRWFRDLSRAVVDGLRVLAEGVRDLLERSSATGEDGDMRRHLHGVRLLVERLAALPAPSPAEDAALEERTWAKVRSRQRAMATDDLLAATPPVAVPERWSGGPQQELTPFRVPLRVFREQITPDVFHRLLPDAALELTWSPTTPIHVTVPVQPGARPDELQGLFLRVFDADSRELLGAAELQPTGIPSTTDGVCVGAALTAEVELPRSFVVDGRRRQPERLKVDLTSDPHNFPPSSDLRRRRKAIRTGMLAASAGRIGDRRTAAHSWRACAACWRALDEHRQRRLAEALAEAAVQRDPAIPPPTAKWFAGECLPVLLDAWADEQLASAERVRVADPPAAMQLARMVITVLGPGSPRLPLAAARLLLARLLVAEGARWAARRQIGRARDLYGRLNHRQGLDDCQRLLAQLHPELPDDPEDRRYAVGVSIRRDELIGVLSDQQGLILDVQRQPLNATDPTEVAVEVATLVRQLLEAGRELDEKITAKTIGLGVELGGPVDHEKGEVVFYSPYRHDPAESLISDDQTWKKVPFARLLAEATGIASVVENDANALAKFELAFGHGQARHMAVLLVGDGIGCGLVLDHQLYRGARGAAGEIGHIVVPGGRKCSSCEREGCLDSLAAVRAILANIGQAKQEPPVPDLETAIELLRKGDKEAREAFEEAGDALAHATADVLNVHSPSRIVLRAPASMLAHDNPFVQAFMTFKMDRFLQIPDDPEVFLEPLRLADGTRGAVLLALERFAL